MTRARIRKAALAAALTLSAAAPGTSFAQETPRAPQAPRPPRTWTHVTSRPLTFGFMLDTGPPLTVKNVVPGSPVARSGIRAGDEIVSVDGRGATVESIREAGRRASPGDTIRFRIRRNGREQTIAVAPDVSRRAAEVARDHYRSRGRVINPDSVRALARLYLDEAKKSIELRIDPKIRIEIDGDIDHDMNSFRFHMDSLGEKIEHGLRGLGPAMESWARQFEGGEIDIDMPHLAVQVESAGWIPGARLSDLEADLASYFPGAESGVLVLSVRSESVAENIGLRAGDVIVGVDGESVDDVTELRRQLRGEESHQLSVVRRGERMTVTFAR